MTTLPPASRTVIPPVNPAVSSSIANRRGFIRLAGGGVVLGATLGLAACSAGLPPESIAAWTVPAADDGDIRLWILSYAILAPHSHNLQSWRVDLRHPGEIMLYCDLTRLLPETDPMSRQIMMSQGTFLELLDLAARQKGWRTDIELFPQGEPILSSLDGRPTARIRLNLDASVKPDALFAQILHRHTNREAYLMREPEALATQAIEAGVRPYPVRTGFVGLAQPDLLQQHRNIACEAWRIEMVTPRTVMESIRLLRVGPNEIAAHRDGITVNTPMLRVLSALGLFDRSNAPGPDDAATTGQIKDFNAKLAETPAFFWMVTEGNSRKIQVQAGRAFVRAQLTATAQGLSMHPLSQALQEYPEQAKPFADVHTLLEAPYPRYTVQMWARLGYAPPVGPSPRRGLGAHLIT
jgi:nitroreductase